MLKLPNKLTRSAIKSTFTKLSEASWDHLFEHEKENGLHAIRVDGDYPKLAYYDTEAIIHWLVRHNHYTALELAEPIGATPLPDASRWGGLVRRHTLI